MRPEFKDINCPFIRTVLSAPDAPHWDSTRQVMQVGDLLQFVRDQPGNGNLDRVLRYFAVVNHGLGNRAQRLFNHLLGAGGQFSTKLVGSDGDHGGDSRIYNPETREFDPAEFAAFIKFSTDGHTMGVSELGAAIQDFNHRHAGRPSDALQSAGEFALLAVLIGNAEGTIRVADMRLLFEANQFPEGARANLGSRTAEQWFTLTNRISEAIAAAAARNGQQAGVMPADRLREGLRSVFGPLAG